VIAYTLVPRLQSGRQIRVLKPCQLLGELAVLTPALLQLFLVLLSLPVKRLVHLPDTRARVALNFFFFLLFEGLCLLGLDGCFCDTFSLLLHLCPEFNLL